MQLYDEKTRPGPLLILSLTIMVSAALSGCGGIETVSEPLPVEDTPTFPPRHKLAPTGSEFLNLTRKFSASRREQAIRVQIISGNVPSHIRQLVPIEITYAEHQATLYVIPDYLAIGSDDDYVIMPMAPRTAMQIAQAFGYMLPTRKLVDDIYLNSAIQLVPKPLYPGPQMRSNAYYQRHDTLIKAQLPERATAYPLIAGHKKDLVLTPRLAELPERLAIYGWHQPDGNPIQPLSLFHGIEYVDYSHGVRLISREAFIDGQAVDLATIFADPALNPLVSDEGEIPARCYL